VKKENPIITRAEQLPYQPCHRPVCTRNPSHSLLFLCFI